MHYSTVTTMLLALTPAFTLGLPTLAARQTSNEESATLRLIAARNLANAAASALGSENDELIHKGVIDSLLLNDPNIQAANNVLVTQGTFQFVVSGLTDLATNGAGYTPDQVLFSVNEINTDRCNLVLPAIDTYLQAAAALSGNAFPAAAAAKPNNCP